MRRSRNLGSARSSPDASVSWMSTSRPQNISARCSTVALPDRLGSRKKVPPPGLAISSPGVDELELVWDNVVPAGSEPPLLHAPIGIAQRKSAHRLTFLRRD